MGNPILKLTPEVYAAIKEYIDMREMGFTLEYDQKNNPNNKLARAAICMISTTLPTDQRLDIEWPEDMDLTMGGYLMSNQKSRKKKLCIAVAFLLAQLALDEAELIEAKKETVAALHTLQDTHNKVFGKEPSNE